MRGHLSPNQLIDVAEGTAPESSLPHLEACDACRRQLAELRATLASVAQVEAPEPSPLFWNALVARVGAAVRTDRERSTSPLGRLRTAAGAVRSWSGPWPVRVAGLAVLVAAVGMLARVNQRSPLGGRTVWSAADGDTAEYALVVDDPSLSLVADLAVELDWEAAGEAGLTTHVGVDDDVVNQLNAAERRELRQLLQGELSPPRRGA